MRYYLLSGYIMGVALTVGQIARMNLDRYETWEWVAGSIAGCLFIGGPLGALIVWPLGWYLNRRQFHQERLIAQKGKLPLE